jgi:tetratricopeptide (TPR) repeat protein
LEKQESKSAAELCLYAALVESTADFEKVEKLMAANSDPTVIRFHCILLERRGEWEEAITVLNRLAATDEGRKASFFKDLSELQRNAGLTQDALATIERWKQSAPTDKTAWVVGSSILRDEAKTDEAIQMIRQAASRFKDDTDLTANLAQLHEEAGQFAEAQSIYWQLYDNSEKPADQARWATNLAEIATQTGRTQELEDQLRERSRNNRRSIGPLLAQAELARLTRDDDKRRDLLLEAVRLQPNNIDLRLQIANLEEQSGNPDRVIAILEEALATDTTGRIRNSLAQAYLRQGQVLKGMRELQKLAGNQANDPRIIETNAASLASSGLYEEAIRYMREALPDGGDWRTKYLLAIMLEQDGRESEAIPLFQTLIQTTEEIPSLTAKALPKQYNEEEDYWDQFPQSMKDIMQLMTVSQAAYMHRNPDRHQYSSYYGSSSGEGMTQIGSFVLPDESKVLRSLVQIHLAKINPKGIENAEFITDLLASGNAYQANYTALLKKYPDYPGLFELAIAYNGFNEESPLDKEMLRKQLETNKSLTNTIRLQIYLQLIHDAEPNDPVWQDTLKVSEEIAKSEKPGELIQLGYMLMQLFFSNNEDTSVEVSADFKKSVSKILLDIATKDLSKNDPMGNFKLLAVNCAGTQDQWIQAVNESVKSHQADKKNQQPTSLASSMYGYQYGRHGYGNPNASPFVLPQIQLLSLRTIPMEVIGMIQPKSEETNYYGFDTPEPKKLIASLDKFESPTLRLWIAINADDQAAIEKYSARSKHFNQFPKRTFPTHTNSSPNCDPLTHPIAISSNG